MKKRILIAAMCVAWVLSSVSALATEQESVVQETVQETVQEATQETVQESKPRGFAIVINWKTSEYTTILRDNKHYFPVRQVFEKIGARVFFRSRDRRILILSRDGDIIYHNVGTKVINVNGENKTLPHPSISENNTTYIPDDMMLAALRTNCISYRDPYVYITRPVANTAYGKAVNDALYAANYSNFQPEKFKRYINYHINKPELSMQSVVYNVNLELDFPFYENVAVIEDPYNPMVMVNKHNRLPDGFVAKNLVNMDRRYTIGDGKQYLMEKNAYDSFVRMAEAARKDGVSIRAVSTYRTEDYQRRLYNRKLNSTGQRNADNYSAKPGFSEHQTGLAVDINSTHTSFEYSSVFKWLQKHAHEYGYIMRYPKGQKWITGYEYEPWHYRYVGVAAATTMHNEGSVYEQYYAKYVAVNEFR